MDDFNWVQELSKCSLSVAFESLRQAVKGDVETRRSLMSETAHYSFRYVPNNEWNFSVIVEGNNLHGGVSFDKRGNEIVIEDAAGKVLVTARVTLNKDRECRFVVGEEELESWQLRKKVLEKLFF